MRYILIIIWFMGTDCYSQGSWNIGYVHINSLNSDYLNSQIKLDFKHDWREINRLEKRSIRHYISPKDTAYLLINSDKTVLIERRAIYVDHGSFNSQFLEIENYDKKLSRRIYDTEILKLEEDRIKVRVLIQNYKIQKEKIKDKLESEIVEFWIDKDKLDGIMIKNKK